MNERATDGEDDTLPIKATSEDVPPMLAAEIIVSQNRPTECTVFPPDATDFERLTTWITAKEGSSSVSKTCGELTVMENNHRIKSMKRWSNSNPH